MRRHRVSIQVVGSGRITSKGLDDEKTGHYRVVGLWALTAMWRPRLPLQPPFGRYPRVDRSVDYTHNAACCRWPRVHLLPTRRRCRRAMRPTRCANPAGGGHAQTARRGGQLTFTLAEIRGNVVDWFPDDHRIRCRASSSRGRWPSAAAPGPGRMPSRRKRQNSSRRAAGACILRQLDDFRNGRRHSVEPGKGTPTRWSCWRKRPTRR